MFSKHKFLHNLWHFKKFWASLHWILTWIIRGVPVKFDTLYDHMRDDPEFCDVTLLWEKVLQFKAYRILLTNRNTFFNTFLKSQSPQSIDLFERSMFFPDSMVWNVLNLLDKYIWLSLGFIQFFFFFSSRPSLIWLCSRPIINSCT